MTERIDHAAEAMNLLDLSRHPGTGDPTIGALYVGAAQAHATLALVEQQRITNHLALARWISSEHIGTKLGDLRMGFPPEVWEGLGLA